MKIICVVALLFFFGCANTSQPVSHEVPLDELLREPAKYNGMLIRTSGHWFMDFESSTLSIDARSRRDGVYVNTDGKACRKDQTYQKFEVERRESAMEQVERYEGTKTLANWTVSASVELEGYFEIAPPEDRVVDADGRELIVFTGFGHLSGYKSQIRLTHLRSFEIHKNGPGLRQ